MPQIDRCLLQRNRLYCIVGFFVAVMTSGNSLFLSFGSCVEIVIVNLKIVVSASLSILPPFPPILGAWRVTLGGLFSSGTSI